MLSLLFWILLLVVDVLVVAVAFVLGIHWVATDVAIIIITSVITIGNNIINFIISIGLTVSSLKIGKCYAIV